MIFKQYVVSGGYASNCYIIGCEETKEAAVIDPGGDGQNILAIVKELGVNVKYIINTHGHLDHISANRVVKEGTEAQILIHKEDASMLTDAKRNMSAFMGDKIAGPAADRELEEGDEIEIGTTIKLKVLHTPGHTRGGICLLADSIIFTGDTLFAGSIGRTDFPGGSYETIIQSIKDKILTLDDSVEVYTGHGPKSTVGSERMTNPFL